MSPFAISKLYLGPKLTQKLLIKFGSQTEFSWVNVLQWVNLLVFAKISKLGWAKPKLWQNFFYMASLLSLGGLELSTGGLNLPTQEKCTLRFLWLSRYVCERMIFFDVSMGWGVIFVPFFKNSLVHFNIVSQSNFRILLKNYFSISNFLDSYLSLSPCFHKKN